VGSLLLAHPAAFLTSFYYPALAAFCSINCARSSLLNRMHSQSFAHGTVHAALYSIGCTHSLFSIDCARSSLLDRMHSQPFAHDTVHAAFCLLDYTHTVTAFRSLECAFVLCRAGGGMGWQPLPHPGNAVHNGGGYCPFSYPHPLAAMRSGPGGPMQVCCVCYCVYVCVRVCFSITCLCMCVRMCERA
jgi:hypothetical protein